jgi:hypothetical protein
MSISERLRDAIEDAPTGHSFDEKVEALHSYVKSQGVRGVHSTRHTLQRWLNDRGVPPHYWLNLAANFLGVTAYWLLTGEGVRVMPAGGAEPGPGTIDEFDGETGEPKGKKEEAPEEEKPKPKAEAKPRARKKKPADPPPPPPPEPEDSIPTKEDVYATSAATIGKYISSSTSVAAIEAILEFEPTNPNKEGGRVTVLKAAEKKLAELKG